MRALPPAIAAHYAAGGHADVQVLVWITARDRETGAPHSLGFWSGADHQEIEVVGALRTYYGAGALLAFEPVASVSSAQERVWSLSVSPLHDQIAEAIRLYDARLAPVEVHEWHHDPLTHLPLADPVRVVRGTLMELDIPTPPDGQESAVTLKVVSDAWRLTKGLTLKRSDEALKARSGGADRFRRYNSLVGINVWWGERSATDAGGGRPRPPVDGPNTGWQDR